MYKVLLKFAFFHEIFATDEENSVSGGENASDCKSARYGMKILKNNYSKNKTINRVFFCVFFSRAISRKFCINSVNPAFH